MYACNGILFNHESERRGETFVTRKITRGLCRVALGLDPCLYLGNLNALRDWGHAQDFVEMQWMMLQQEVPDDYVISTGIQESVRGFVDRCLRELGIEVEWLGKDLEERAVVTKVDPYAYNIAMGSTIVKVDPRYFRPAEVETLCGDASKARSQLGWVPQRDIDQLVTEMITADLLRAKREKLLVQHG